MDSEVTAADELPDTEAHRFAALHEAVKARAYWAGLRARRLKRRALDRRSINAYLESHAVKRLQLGTGPNPLPGWLNTDVSPDTYREHRDKIVFLDAGKEFPFADRTFDFIFSEHQIEHISESEARIMLSECFRVLRPGGRLRIATPDLGAIVRLHAGPHDELAQRYVHFMVERFMPDAALGDPSCHVINHMFRAHGHQFIYDQKTLSAMLAAAGFVDIVRYEPGESDDPELHGLEAHGRAIGDEEVNRFETMVLEAMRRSS